QFRESLKAVNAPQLIEQIRGANSREASRSPKPGFCRVIQNRRELYSQCRELLTSADSIRDTTWGRRAKPLSAAEKQARGDYRLAVEGFVQADKPYEEH